MKPPKSAGIYCRLSYAPDGSLEKVERQESDCRQLAERLDWPVSDAHVYPDNSRSAWQRNRKRPQWDRMLAAVDAGEIDAIIVYHGDRLIRQPYDLERLIGIADARGVRIASPSGTRDLDSPDDRFVLRIEAAQACRESDNTSRRVLRGVAARAARGASHQGGRRPYGYGLQTGTRPHIDPLAGEETRVPVRDRTLQVPEEAALLADAVDRLLAGQSQGGVVRWLTTEGAVTTEGGPFTAKCLRNLVLSPRIAGLIDHQGALYEGAWDPIISRETWEDVKALYRRNAEEHPHAGRSRVHLLSGVGGAECGLCRATVGVKPSGGRNRKTSRIYHCPACRGIGRSVELLDAHVEGRVLRLLNDRRFSTELDAGDDGAPGVGAEIAELERRKAETRRTLENLVDHPDVDPGLLAVSLGSFDRRIAEARSRMTTSAARRLLLRMRGMTREGWAEEPVDVRAATVRALYRVVILPTTRRGPGFDVDAVRLERRPLPGIT
jgi:DNA invertase Pin-like site-specific DNA recombinase